MGAVENGHCMFIKDGTQDLQNVITVLVFDSPKSVPLLCQVSTPIKALSYSSGSEVTKSHIQSRRTETITTTFHMEILKSL